MAAAVIVRGLALLDGDVFSVSRRPEFWDVARVSLVGAGRDASGTKEKCNILDGILIVGPAWIFEFGLSVGRKMPAGTLALLGVHRVDYF